MEVKNFLPKYPYIEEKDPFEPYDVPFNQAILDKKEFYEDKLNPSEGRPKPGEFFKHQKIVAKYLSHHTLYNGLLLYHEMGTGKCHKIDTPIMLGSGKIAKVQDLNVGDKVMGDDSSPRTILSLCRGVDDMYEIIPRKGDPFTVNKEHILCLKAPSYPAVTHGSHKKITVSWLENNTFCSKSFSYFSNEALQKKLAREFRDTIKWPQVLEIPVKDYLNLSKTRKSILKLYRVGVEFEKKPVPFDAYTLGYLLGDGKSSNKHIPDIYKHNSRKIRLEVLAGLIDSSVEFTQKNERVMNDVVYLAQSLGFNVKKTYKKTGVCCISGEGIEDIPTLIKKLVPRKQVKDVLVTSFETKYVGRDNYYGFTLDGNSRYLMGDFTVTHNSLTAFGTTEAIFQSKNSPFKRAYVIVSGQGLIANLKRQLVYGPTQGSRYLPEDVESLSEKTKTRRINALVHKYYKFSTYDIFSKEIRAKSQEQLRRDYSDSIFILDEVHHLHPDSPRENKDEDVLAIYASFLQLFDSIRNHKTLLLSGTPMRNDVSELAYIMNLILPARLRLPVGNAFDKMYMYKKDDIMLPRPERIDELKAVFRGRVSYLTSPSSNVNIIHEGVDILNTGSVNFNLVPDMMSLYQNEEYTRIHQEDLMGRQTRGIQIASRQAASFIFPPGEEEKWSTQFRRQLSSINGLRKYSSKFASTIQAIIEHRDELSFVYSRFVEKVGIRLFAKVLALYGYRRSNGTERMPGRRYILLQSGKQTVAQLQKQIRYFNSNKNKNGKFVQVIIGSGFISEGFSFMNIQQIHILTPHWNYAETLQAIARGIRTGSHRELVNPTVRIYQHCATVRTANDPDASVDVLMYRFSYHKDRSIKSMDRLLKESAFDCALTYDQNNKSMKENSRQCDYQECTYNCDGIITMAPPFLDVSTFQLYYAQKEEQQIEDKLRLYFAENNQATLDTLFNKLSSHTPFTILAVLTRFVINSVPVIDSFEQVSYLREFNNEYTLVQNINETADQFNVFYSDHLIEALPPVDFEQILGYLYQHSLGTMIYNMSLVRDPKVIREMVKSLPLIIQEMFIEASVEAMAKQVQERIVMRETILRMFKEKIIEKPRMIVSTLNPNNLRCFDKTTFKWGSCHPDFVAGLEREKLEKKQRVQEAPYHGVIRDGDLYIVKRQEGPVTDKRKKRQGARCIEAGYSKSNLVDILMDANVPTPFDTPQDRRKFWLAKTKPQLCGEIQDYFKQNNLLL